MKKSNWQTIVVEILRIVIAVIAGIGGGSAAASL